MCRGAQYEEDAYVCPHDEGSHTQTVGSSRVCYATICDYCGETLAQSGNHDYVSGECTRCGYKDPSYVPEHEHTIDWYRLADTHQKFCSSCRETLGSEEPHSYVGGVCEVCGVHMPEPDPEPEYPCEHTDVKMIHNDTNHWYVCEDCGVETSDYMPHDFHGSDYRCICSLECPHSVMHYENEGAHHDVSCAWCGKDYGISEHTKEYKDDGFGYHNVRCTNCDEQLDYVPHSFDSKGKCICGAKAVVNCNHENEWNWYAVSNVKNHYFACGDCGTRLYEEDHGLFYAKMWNREREWHTVRCGVCNGVCGTEPHDFTGGKCACNMECPHTDLDGNSTVVTQSGEDQHWQYCTLCQTEVAGTRVSHDYIGDGSNKGTCICSATCSHNNMTYTSVDAQEYHNAYCAACDQTFQEEHELGEGETKLCDKYNEKLHWVVCQLCGDYGGMEEHAFKNGVCTGNGCDQECTFDDFQPHKEGEYCQMVCTVCGEIQEGTETRAHTYDYENAVCKVCQGTCDHVASKRVYSGNATHCRVECAACGTRLGRIEHEFSMGECVACQAPCKCDAFVYNKELETESTHAKVCKTCGKIANEAEKHSFKAGVCTVCNFECNHENAEIVKVDHNLIHRKNCDNCGEVGMNESHKYVGETCEICQYVCAHDKSVTYAKKDDEHHVLTCKICKVVKDTEHTYINGVCKFCSEECDHTNLKDFKPTESNSKTHQGTCVICEETIEQPHSGKVAKEAFGGDDEKHKIHCEACGAAYGTEAHNFVNDVCTADAEKGIGGCGFVYRKHQASGEYTINGMKHSSVCSICGNSFDEADHVFVDGSCVCGLVCGSSDLPHDFADCDCGTVNKDAHDHTCERCGYTCDDAGHTVQHTADGHTMTCTKCGKRWSTAGFEKRYEQKITNGTTDPDKHNVFCTTCNEQLDDEIHTEGNQCSKCDFVQCTHPANGLSVEKHNADGTHTVKCSSCNTSFTDETTAKFEKKTISYNRTYYQCSFKAGNDQCDEECRDSLTKQNTENADTHNLLCAIHGVLGTEEHTWGTTGVMISSGTGICTDCSYECKHPNGYSYGFCSICRKFIAW